MESQVATKRIFAGSDVFQVTEVPRHQRNLGESVYSPKVKACASYFIAINFKKPNLNLSLSVCLSF